MTILAPTYLAPVWRYTNNDWAGANALRYTVYQTPPVFASDGVTVVTAGVPTDLTGCIASGVITIRASGQVIQAPAGAIVDAPNGIFSLSLTRSATQFIGQPLSDWGMLTASLLIVRPNFTDATGNLVTQGIQPLFVF